MTASQAFSQKLYESAARDENAAGTSASGQTGGATSGDDDIVDAEIVEEHE
jgi:molecular chaperone DnaK